MTIKSTIPAIVAAFALGGAGAAFAEGPTQQNTAGTYGAGAATANSDSVSAGGVAAGKATTQTKQERRAMRQKHRNDRAAERAAEPAEANSATTYGSGVVSTTRDSAKAGVTTGGAASGSGVQSTGSTVDAYGETTRDGSNADIYGDSTATSGEKAR